MGFPLCVTCCFSLAAFNILSLCLVFVSLISMCLGVFLLGFPVWDSLCLLDLIGYFLFHVGEIFNYNLLQTFLIPFLFLFFWDLYNSNVGAFDMVPEVSETVLSSSHSFYFFCTSEVISTILSSSSLIHSFASDILLLIDSRIFLTTVIVLFFLHCYSLIFLGLLKLILAFSPFWFQGLWSSLLSLFWIIFQGFCLFPFHLFGFLCFYFVPSLVQYFSAFSFFF